MNYIVEINMFYDWLETNQIPKSAIALWHGLMHIANKTGWKQSFTVAISTIESKTGFKRSELMSARNILSQKGRIVWKERGGNLSAEYSICFFCDHNTATKSSQTGTQTRSQTGIQTPTITKLKETKLKETKQDDESKSSPTPFEFLNVEDCKARYLKIQQAAIEQICMAKKIKLESIPIWLDQFNKHLIREGTELKVYRDYVTHFSRWMNKQDTNQKFTNGSNQSTPGGRIFDSV